MRDEAPTLLEGNVDHWLHNQPERSSCGASSRVPDGAGSGRAWLSDECRRLGDIEIAKRIFPVFDEIPGLTFHQAALTDTRFYLRALLPSLEREIAVGK